MRINKYIPLGLLILIVFAIATQGSEPLPLITTPVEAQEIMSNSNFNAQEILRNALQWVDSLGAVGAIAFMLIYIIATVAFLPGSIRGCFGFGLCFYWCNFGCNPGVFSRTLRC
jgi:hypothetical protein